MMTNSVLLLVTLLAMTLMFTKGDQVDDLFSEYDQDGDGVVSPAEIEKQLGAGMITENNYVAAYDEDNDGNLNREEFENFAKFANIENQSGSE